MKLNSFKIFLIGSWLLLSPNLFAQGLVEYPNHDRIYKGFNNYFEFASVNGDTLLFVNASNATLTKKGKGYIVLPTGNKNVQLTITNSNKDTLATKVFRVFAVPQPELYLGNIKNGEKLIDRMSTQLKVLYDPYSALGNVAFAIKSWEIYVGENVKVCKGTGEELTEEAIEMIRVAKDGERFKIVCNYVNFMNDSRTQSVSAVFIL